MKNYRSEKNQLRFGTILPQVKTDSMGLTALLYAKIVAAAAERATTADATNTSFRFKESSIET